MGKKLRGKFGNSRPRHNFDQDTIYIATPPGLASPQGLEDDDVCKASEPPAPAGPQEATITNIVKHSIHEVGRGGSNPSATQFPGTDTYGRDMKGATFANREKYYERFDLLETYDDDIDLDDAGFPIGDAVKDVSEGGGVVFRQYVYDNTTKERDSDGVMIRKSEDQTVLINGFDEGYFQHVFSWPTTHALRTRKIGGFLTKTTVTNSIESDGQDPEGGCAVSTTSYDVIKAEHDYNANFTLEKAVSKVYAIQTPSDNKKGTDKWDYKELNFDPTTGELTTTGTEEDKLGKPVIYHGDSDSDAIFFNYNPSTSSSTVSSVITHNFDDNANQNISFTESNTNIKVSVRNPDDRGGSNNSQRRKHYSILFPNRISSVSDVRIHFNTKQTASGISRSRLFISKIVQDGNRRINVWFQDESGVNTYARDWTVSAGGAASGTSEVIAIGDTINGATVTNVVNYVEEVALIRTVSKQPRRGVEDKNVTVSKFTSLTKEDGTPQGLTNDDWLRIRSWIRLNDAREIIPGMELKGYGIKNRTTTVVGVDYAKNKVYLSDTLKEGKLKNVKFVDDQVNRVSKHTLCYATLSGGGNFTIDADYDVTRAGSTACSVKVRAGRGIINRTAIVGTWFSDVKHEIEYQPLFYGSPLECEKEVDSDEFGEYVLGSIIWGGDTRTEGKYLLTKPSNEFSYTVSQTYFALTYAPIDQETLRHIEITYNTTHTPIDFTSGERLTNEVKYQIYNIVVDYIKSSLGSLRAAAVFDDLCREPIQPSYFNIYDPIDEQFNLVKNIEILEKTVDTACLVENEELNPNLDSSNETIENIESLAAESSVLPPGFYEAFANGENSLLSKIKGGFDSIENAKPTTRVPKLPPQIVGEDQSGRTFIAKSFRDIPPATDRVGYFCNDLIVLDDQFLNPILDLNPTTTINQPKIIIRSQPIWSTDATSGVVSTITTPSCAGGDPLSATMSVTVTNSGSRCMSIKTSGAIVNGTATCSTGIPGSVGSSQTTVTLAWTPVSDPKKYNNADFFTRQEWPNYTINTNWALPPGEATTGGQKDPAVRTNLRDLGYLERGIDPVTEEYINDQLTAPTAYVYPEDIWEANVNYQQDFHKTLEFRLAEHAELIGETIENKGNPYIDKAISATLTKTLEASDTVIHVNSTGEFLSSGYLIIPKYTQKIMTFETGNNNGYYTYAGEEIIYYGSKTDTTFNNIQRGKFGTTSVFEETVPMECIEPGVKYKIASLGNSNWHSIGVEGAAAQIGDIFTATGEGIGTGEVVVFGTTPDETPEPKLLSVLEALPKVAVISSYEKGFSIAQHHAFSLNY